MAKMEPTLLLLDLRFSNSLKPHFQDSGVNFHTYKAKQYDTTIIGTHPFVPLFLKKLEPQPTKVIVPGTVSVFMCLIKYFVTKLAWPWGVSCAEQTLPKDHRKYHRTIIGILQEAGFHSSATKPQSRQSK